jgi:hypothetical protein
MKISFLPACCQRKQRFKGAFRSIPLCLLTVLAKPIRSSGTGGIALILNGIYGRFRTCYDSVAEACIIHKSFPGITAGQKPRDLWGMKNV